MVDTDCCHALTFASARLSCFTVRNQIPFFGNKKEKESPIGMLTDIRINPDNKLSGNIRIINYPFNYPSTWRLILFMYFLCSFAKFLRYFTTILYINPSISKIIVADLNVLPLGYSSATLRYPPLPAHYDFYDFI